MSTMCVYRYVYNKLAIGSKTLFDLVSITFEGKVVYFNVVSNLHMHTIENQAQHGLG